MYERSETPALIAYTSGDGAVKLDVKLTNGTLWLTQEQMANLFGVVRSAVTKHIATIYADGELDASTTCSKMEQVVANNRKYPVLVYSLAMVIAVGYKVNSTVAITFRQWATQTLKEYMVKGFVMDDRRLAEPGDNYAGADYFEELLNRVRAIRASEKMFYEKVKAIFSETSRDYNSKSQAAQAFYATIQNKFHFAVTGKTAAEIVTSRIDAQKINAGMTHYKGDRPKLADAKVAKNYMLENELRRLYLISEQFLSFAELKIETKRAMTMAEWAKRLDDMLALNELPVLKGSGNVSHERMERKVKQELTKYKTQNIAQIAD